MTATPRHSAIEAEIHWLTLATSVTDPVAIRKARLEFLACAGKATFAELNELATAAESRRHRNSDEIAQRPAPPAPPRKAGRRGNEIIRKPVHCVICTTVFMPVTSCQIVCPNPPCKAEHARRASLAWNRRKGVGIKNGPPAQKWAGQHRRPS